MAPRHKLFLPMLLVVVAFYALVPICPTEGAKILLLTAPVSKGGTSQLDLMVHLGETLAAKGHTVTILLQGEQKIKSLVLHQDRCPSAVNKTYIKSFSEELKKVAPRMLRGTAVNRDNVRMFGTIFLQECHKQLKHEEMFRKHKRHHFDLAIIDHVHICGYLYARRLGVRYVTLECSSYLTLLADSLTPSPLAYVPVFTSRLTDRMTFLERLKNTAMAVFMKYIILTIITTPYDEIKEEYNIDPRKSAQDLRMNSELWLVNSDMAFDFPRPMMPNTIMVGGMLLRPAKCLDPLLEEFVAGAGEAGIIVVSFGSALDLSYMPDLIEMFVNALRDLPQRVVWGSKFVPRNLPDSFKVIPWIPQQDLLGHAATKCFITHGGINSLFEALYHAVPTFVIPSTADAFDNVVRFERKGTLLWRQYIDMTYEHLRSDVIALVNDKKYKTKAMWLSSVFQDQPLKPDARAVFWVNHVIKHGGRHLRSAAFDLEFYQYHMLDVIAFIAFVTIFSLAVFCCCCRFCFRKFKNLFPAHVQPLKPKDDSEEENDGGEECERFSSSSNPRGNDHFFQPAGPQHNLRQTYGHAHSHQQHHGKHQHGD